jgi:hypothetical protein
VRVRLTDCTHGTHRFVPSNSDGNFGWNSQEVAGDGSRTFRASCEGTSLVTSCISQMATYLTSAFADRVAVMRHHSTVVAT